MGKREQTQLSEFQDVAAPEAPLETNLRRLMASKLKEYQEEELCLGCVGCAAAN